MFGNRLTDAVKHLLIINVLVYFATLILFGEPSREAVNGLINERISDFTEFGKYMLAMFYPTSDFFKPYQIVTHMFMHADFGHLFFNMLGLLFLGPAIEYAMGKERFLAYYFLTGLGAMLLYLGVRFIELNYMGESPFAANVPMLGASGAVFGVFAAFAMYYPEQKLQLLFPPVALKAKYMVLIMGAFELFFGLSPIQTGVAHFAHLGGAIVGVLIIHFWYKRYRR